MASERVLLTVCAECPAQWALVALGVSCMHSAACLRLINPIAVNIKPAAAAAAAAAVAVAVPFCTGFIISRCVSTSSAQPHTRLSSLKLVNFTSLHQTSA